MALKKIYRVCSLKKKFDKILINILLNTNLVAVIKNV